MPKQMRGGSFTVRPGHQASLSRKIVVRTREVRFKPGHPWPVQAMMKGIKELAESQEERIQQA